jgi:hypothetical protein
MKTKILIILILLIIFSCLAKAQSEKVLDITLNITATGKEILQFGDGVTEPKFNITNYTNFNIELKSLKMNTLDKETVYVPSSGRYIFSIELLSENNELIDKFDLGESFLSDGGIFDQTNKNFVISYDETARYLKISYENQQKLLLDIPSLLCNKNNFCDSTENYYSCQEDCSLSNSDGSCISVEDGICDPDCVFDEDCSNSQNNQQENFLKKNLTLLFIGILSITILILVIVIIVVVSKKKK